jgi:hypothetical protein
MRTRLSICGDCLIAAGHLQGSARRWIIIHHTNRNGEARGSSDFKPASDQAFLVSNEDRNGGRLLDAITLQCEKSRYGLSETITYRYDGGQMQRIEENAPSKTVTERLRELLIANSGILTHRL